MASRQSRPSTKKQQPVTAQAGDSSVSGEILSPDELARALRAVAAELERDPALARRVAGAMRSPASDGPPTDPAAIHQMDAVADDTAVQPLRRAARAFKPRLVTGATSTLGTGVPDPFALYEQLGEDGFRAALNELRLGTLRAIVREHHLDPNGQLAGQNDDAKYRALIVRAAKRPKRSERR